MESVIGEEGESAIAAPFSDTATFDLVCPSLRVEVRQKEAGGEQEVKEKEQSESIQSSLRKEERMSIRCADSSRIRGRRRK